MIPLYENVYQLFPHTGFRRRHGSTKIDISTLMTYVAIDKYLKRNGRLGFLITQSVFKTAGGGQGFRRFQLSNREPIQVLDVDDMVELKSFEGVRNRTSIVILQKGRKTTYPVAYNYWIKKVKRKSIRDDLRLDEVTQIATYKKFIAEPVSENDPTSPWITGRPKAIKAVKKVLGKSGYVAQAGVYSGGANAVFWVEVIDKRPDGLIIISNITEGAKSEVESVQTAIEPDFLYPLLKGGDVKKWKADSSALIITPQDPTDPKHGCPESKLKSQCPKTFLYLERFKKVLENRPAYLKYLKGEPFYSLYDIKNYIFAPYKVVWRYIATDFICSVVGLVDGKPVIPNEKLMLVNCDRKEEAYYLCGICNSSPSRFIVISYGVGTQLAPHILQNIRIPKYDPTNKLHLRLAELSKKAHQIAKTNDQAKLKDIEEEIDEVSAQIWGLTKEELKEIKSSLEELI